jgi:hypothetical protein
MEMKKTLIFMVLLLASFMLTSISTNIYAGDSKIYPGIACQVQEPNALAYFKHEQEALTNIRSTPTAQVNHIVNCPIVKDYVNNKPHAVRAYVWVYRQANIAQPVTCDLFTRKDNGTFLRSNTGTFKGSGRGRIKLEVKPVSNVFTYHLIRCYVPARGKIFSYRVIEDP